MTITHDELDNALKIHGEWYDSEGNIANGDESYCWRLKDGVDVREFLGSLGIELV